MENKLDTQSFDQPQRRSIDYLVRNMQEHHMILSNMADQKAQILLGICSLILTFSLTQIVQADFSFGLASLCIFMFLAIVPAILAVTPRLGPKDPDAQKKKAPPRLRNPLFFGNFADIGQEQFLEEMSHVIENSDKLYEAQFLNVYNNGKILAEKKYRLITISYNIFLVGIVIGTVVTLLELLIF